MLKNACKSVKQEEEEKALLDKAFEIKPKNINITGGQSSRTQNAEPHFCDSYSYFGRMSEP